MKTRAVAAGVRERTCARPSEPALATLWQRAHALPEGLVTEEGRRFRVVYSGRPNNRAGPDFRDAIVTTEDGELIFGDVELHLKARDWYGHGHHSDPNYNGVVLHVVLWPKGTVTSRQQSGTSTPVASIAPVIALLEQADTSAHPVLQRHEVTDGGEIDDILDRAGDQRFLDRSAGFARELADTDPDQVLYSALMEALGYASNQRPFRQLADRVPMSKLALLKEEPPMTRLVALRAMLVGGAGLVSLVRPAQDARGLRRLLRHLSRTRPMSAGQWQLFRVRPANHPLVRIIGAAHIVDRNMDAGLVHGLARGMLDPGAGTLVQSLKVSASIGTGRAGDMVVNVVLPFIHAYASAGRLSGLGTTALEMYRGFPGLAGNEITREMKRLLGQESGAATYMGARRQQGLIHLYRRLATGDRHWTGRARVWQAAGRSKAVRANE